MNVKDKFSTALASSSNDVRMPPQAISLDVLMEKYAKEGETTIEQVQRRVAKALAQVEKEDERDRYEQLFYEVQQAGFVPAGRINSAAGMDLRATLINCFVQPVGDSVSELTNGKVGIYTALLEAAETMRRGGGVGYDFSAIRPRDACVKGTQSRASGPVSFMHVFNASCSTVESAGARRGAQMGVLRCDHPDIVEFIRAKDKGALTNFNISIGVTDAFMQAVSEGTTFDLIHPAQPSKEKIAQGAHQNAQGWWVYETIQARDLWEAVMQSTYDHAEPGILFLSRIHAENNLAYCETIEATNPCGEQPLPDYGCCCLGSMNLTSFVEQAFTKQAHFNFTRFEAAVKVAVRMLDNVLDATEWPLIQQKAEAHAKRRIGLGFLGLGSALIMLGKNYSHEEGRQFAAQIAEQMRNHAYEASIALAQEKGAFPLLHKEAYLQSAFIKRLPSTLKDKIAQFGIRNSHLTSIAPTGTITLAFADNASNGIEPAFSWVYQRKKRLAEGGHAMYEVADHAWRLYRELGNDVSEGKLPPPFVNALEMSAQAHMQMLQAVQPFIDSAISKTVNVPADYPYADFQNLYIDAWKAGLKGLATYRPNSVLGSVLSVANSNDAPTPTPHTTAAPYLEEDLLRKQFERRPVGDLESLTSKIEYFTFEGKKTVYLTISFIHLSGTYKGKPITIERPFEFFMPAGQRNDGQQWISASMRLLSMVARSGGNIAKALADMREVVWDKGTVRCGALQKTDEEGNVFEIPLHHDSEVAAIGYALQRMLIKRGFLDASGNLISVEILAEHFARSHPETQEIARVERVFNQSSDKKEGENSSSNDIPYASGKKCPECGAHAMQKIDGCHRCVACGHVGGCG